MRRDDFNLNEALYRLSKALSDAELRAVEAGLAELDEYGYLRPRRVRSNAVRPVYLPRYRYRTISERTFSKVSEAVTLLYVISMFYMLLLMF